MYIYVLYVDKKKKTPGVRCFVSGMGWGWGIGGPWDGDVLYRGNRETNPGRCIPPGPYVRYIQGTIIFQKPLHYVILHSGHLPVLPYFKSQKDWIQRAMQTPLSSSIRKGILQVAYYHSEILY